LDDLRRKCGNYIKMTPAVREVCGRVLTELLWRKWRTFVNTAMNSQVL
jgi:hypothetical protein